MAKYIWTRALEELETAYRSARGTQAEQLRAQAQHARRRRDDAATAIAATTSGTHAEA